MLRSNITTHQLTIHNELLKSYFHILEMCLSKACYILVMPTTKNKLNNMLNNSFRKDAIDKCISLIAYFMSTYFFLSLLSLLWLYNIVQWNIILSFFLCLLFFSIN